MHGYENVLIVGSGGREHALGWKVSQNEHIHKVIYANGNGGTAENIPILPTKINELADYARKNKCFTIVGPEIPLSMGIVDGFQAFDLPIFGPTKSATKIESSKEFSKNFMKKYGIPTSDYRVFTDYGKAVDFVNRIDYQAVIKADGLAAGKGVFVSNSKSEAIDAIDLLLNKKVFGDSSNKIIVEKKIVGDELSMIAICDGKNFVILDSCRDYKRAFDNDMGPNTGGMGSYSPIPEITEIEKEYIAEKIFQPAIKGMNTEGSPFKGFLYAGLIIEKHTGKPHVLEFNARMGDPECQPLMMRMQSDLFQYIEAAEHQALDTMDPVEWKKKYSVCVVMTSKGYPDKYETGYNIKGISNNYDPDLMLFHSGTKLNQDKELVTAGGRVLSITSIGNTLNEAIERAYKEVYKISWGNDQQQFRKDIGFKSLQGQV
ncbi:phosphoribosylamine--glycine ligase [Candidatus Nitrosocosmicus franklandus]|uniref:Phosphoribosylamine--glycine ligase n=1 Tax=Candidatus Nitrosocosmicus franklandianus TaxID=1798806 RepID=A0A484I9Q9_9ARCH|nr:phosphoribosylamine--glycine ligase [Candidatus Nitrosocosmicus franklandus]VFJ12732.1 Phosphoribosylamine--glycine ligase [Candidatus Nitrosocosmicus franklandus]